jgi:hypothetical protein
MTAVWQQGNVKMRLATTRLDMRIQMLAFTSIGENAVIFMKNRERVRTEMYQR